MSTKPLLSLVLSMILLVAAACGEKDEETEKGQVGQEAEPTNEAEETATDTPDQSDLPDPDLEDIPSIVAEVNGDAIAKEEFAELYVSTLHTYALQGLNVEKQDDGELEQQIKEQTIETLIGQTLLIQEANNRSLTASQDEIEKRWTSFKEQFASEEEFHQALQKENYTEKNLKEDIKNQIKVEKLVEDEASDINVSEEELREMYEELNHGQSSEESSSPSFEESKDQLKQQILEQKEGRHIQKLVEDLRQSGSVSVYLDHS
ncbi:SurA N-terminal domain-containing protein [Alteribacillus persepolensis]|uniref:peptidylprolyl isomerase n=1 Tax=Alteribacillus persepolensis TaxID=568899 RepID=A0A1G7YZY8_9BACI|nr:SurA N-terminal domain-containing protein [Alteribacillus persepolensis]SDH02023.1 SurA N-terminal domain-containing protein [Alteribacillus persepolensis]